MRTLLATLFFLLPGLAAAQNTIEVTGDICTQTWTADNTYILVDRVFVGEGCDLTIEPGTVVRGRFSANPDDAAALVITRGAQIFADGERPDGTIAPIIFTAEEDDLADPFDLIETDRGRWGGVIILGRARINVSGGENAIEGLPPTEPQGQYGGTDDDDDSGVFRYVSIRHGGAAIDPDNEINGLTMGGVGRGTTVEYVEVFANLDDGYEWFGGTVDSKYLVAAFVGDDNFDYDEGWRGNNQFWFAVQGSDDAGSGGEHDGGTTPEDGTPYAIPVIYNATYIGSGADSPVSSNDYALNIRDNAGGQYYNSIFTDFFGRAVQVENLSSGEDTWNRFLQGDLVLENNLWFGFGTGGTTPLELFRVGGDGAMDADRQQFADYMTANNQIVDPALVAISRTSDETLDPRPSASSPAVSGAVAPPNNGFFQPVSYLGAFDPNAPTWMSEWTFLDRGGYLSGEAVPNEDGTTATGFGLEAAYPNPVATAATVTFELERAETATVAVYDLLGREVAVLARGTQRAGTTTVRFDAASLPTGVYFVRLATETATATQKIVVVR